MKYEDILKNSEATIEAKTKLKGERKVIYHMLFLIAYIYFKEPATPLKLLKTQFLVLEIRPLPLLPHFCIRKGTNYLGVFSVCQIYNNQTEPDLVYV